MLRRQVIDLPAMNVRLMLRLIGLAAAICLMGLPIVFMTIRSQCQAGELRARLNQVDSESFRITDEFRDFLRQVNNSLYRYGGEHDPADLEHYARASRQLDLWIDAQKPKLRSEPENELMRQIDVGYDVYLRAANVLQAKLVSLGQQNATMSDYAGLRETSQRLFDLGQALAKAHYQSRGVLLAQANQTITQLRRLVLVSLGCLFALGVALARVVYRDMIAPLCVRLPWASLDLFSVRP